MFSQPAPVPPALSPTTTASGGSTSPTRSGRLRGLSYLRNYTHNHLLSRDASNPRPSCAAPSPTAAPTTAAATTAIDDSAFVPSPWSDPTPRSHTEPVVRSVLDGIIAPSPAATWSSPSPAVYTHHLAAAYMARTRSATTATETSTTATPVSPPVPRVESLPSIRFTSHQDLRANDRGPSRPSLIFSPMSRTLPTGTEIIRVGRYSERDNIPIHSPHVPSAAPVGFKSKVVSRRHCEFWCQNGRWFIKDVKSSSGTFLNHVRLSGPGIESKPFPVNDGDIVQLGIDFKGGEEMIFRCVKIRIELNRGWQSSLNSFNLQSHKRLRDLQQQSPSAANNSSQDCSICLNPVAPCQSLFVAPCSHTWHYKCVRVMINGPTWPQFICPNCRAVADLEAEVDDPYVDADWEEIRAVEAEPATATEEKRKTVAVFANLNGGGSTTAHLASLTEDASLHRDTSDVSGAQEHTHVDSTETSTPANQSVPDIRHQSDDSLVASDAADPQSSDVVSHSATAAPIPIRHTPETSSGSRSQNRTPSPDALSPFPREAGVEGPMTPRNDAGPFVFDGSAGQPSDAANLATVIDGAKMSSTSGNL